MSSTDMEKNLENRRWLIERLRSEVVGPDPAGERLIDSKAIGYCMTWEQFREPITTDMGEEVLWQDPPTKRYGSGILYPRGEIVSLLPNGNDQNEVNSDLEQDAITPLSDKEYKQSEKVSRNKDLFGDTSEDAEIDINGELLPSSMSISLLAELGGLDQITVELVSVGRLGGRDREIIESASGIYKTMGAEVYNPNSKRVTKRIVYLRQSLLTSDGGLPRILIPTKDLLGNRVKQYSFSELDGLCIQVVSRRWGTENNRLLTISLINNRKGSKETASIFQSGFRVSSIENESWILPYPESTEFQREHAGIETKILDLNYNRLNAFAVGHGVSADWKEDSPLMVSSVWTDSMPLYEMPSTIPELQYVDSTGEFRNLKVSMRKLSGLDTPKSDFDEADILISEYDKWINNISDDGVRGLSEEHGEAAQEVIRRLQHCSRRIKKGRELLEENQSAARAFELANLAMYVAQSRPRGERNPVWSLKDATYFFDTEYQAVDFAAIDKNIGYWRPFQIAFLLMSIQGIVDESSVDRNEVDLIWFPTGGGKTEAYLGVIAFLLFYQRLENHDEEGVSVLMRYTLRLLTAQQFERAATLFCSMEFVRKKHVDELGEDEFSIGLWVGRETSPNKRKDAIFDLKGMYKDPSTAKNPFILRRCPWCSAKFGAFSTERAGNRVLGYQEEKGTVVYRCPDHDCEYSASNDPLFPESKSPLPVSVIDEDLIDSPPHLLVATVDKFALLAWKPELRKFFGINDEGERASSPPSLILQDELHLISGPLGTIVGAYETAIEQLAVRDGVKPKIIASTATISNAQEQIRNLYGRAESIVFPPSGLDVNDSFFARESREEDGSPSPGRIYVGVMAPSYLSMQTTEARVFATLLQWPSVPEWSDAERDPWWTLLCFFNSLRELGSAATLMLADTREYLRVIATRHGLDMSKQFRSSLFPTELTSRVPSYQIPEVLNQLEVNYKSDGTRADYASVPIDACLASNIIEVGVDVPRLSLMTVVGQPKTTSQYIQVSSRVGRHKDRPGLVVTMYSHNKARDISHFEKFRGYHQKVYSYVEPTSVTPFSIPSVERTLHALAVILIRQLSEKDGLGHDPTISIPDRLLQYVREVIRDRVDIVSPEDSEKVINKLEQRLREWQYWIPQGYGVFQGLPEDPSLMYQAGQTPPETWGNFSWPTLTSMRGVDGASEAEVTSFFNDPSNFESN